MDEVTEGGVASEAERLRRARDLKGEAAAVAADPVDRAEIAAILKDMEPLRPCDS
ncbi:hypothetical protein [Actinomadura decatromicini]|uniref:hypothetical protein n=1 Tax=Actinomadura decatromicini TaxID=2604572 RepID=UPI001652F673|nr:hypothetical protein [Actinomadura decatromicini]